MRADAADHTPDLPVAAVRAGVAPVS